MIRNETYLSRRNSSEVSLKLRERSMQRIKPTVGYAAG
jgi:hypothetical protein